MSENTEGDILREPKINISDKELRVILEKIPRRESSGTTPAKRFKGQQIENTIIKQASNNDLDIIGRTEQFRILRTLFGKEEVSILPGCVFLWGPPSSGKSYTLEMALEGKDINLLRIHCAEILCGRRAFYETLVKQLVSGSTTLDPSFKCDSLHSLFSNFYEYLYGNENHRSLPVVLVIKGTENLRGEYDDILRFLVSLQDIIQFPICVVFISTLPPRHYMPNIMDHSIIPVYFPQYSMDELCQILIQQQIIRSGVSKAKFYEFYAKMIVNMFYYACRDLRKLSRLARSHWDKFAEMAETSQEVNYTRLWKKLEPQLKEQFFELNSALSAISLTENHESERKKLEMPLNAKYLLIASYIATHNPPSSDKRFFVKSKTGKIRKGRAGTSKTDTHTFVRAFELNRLNAIFGSIQTYCDDKAVNKNRNISFMTLLTTLCQNKLIQHIGEDSFGNQKYRCLLDYDAILEISRSVNFELNNYLFRLI